MIETERAKLAYATSITDSKAAAIAKMKTVVIPSLDIKEGTTLANALLTLSQLGKKYDTLAKSARDKGFMICVAGTSVMMFGAPFSEQEDEVPATDTTPALPAISTGAISFYDAVKTVVTSANMDFNVSGNGDLVGIYVIPKMPVVVIGDVAKPCKIFVHEVRDLTVPKAIELAGGLTGPADQCQVGISPMSKISDKVSNSKDGTTISPRWIGKLSDLVNGEAADLHSGDVVTIIRSGNYNDPKKDMVDICNDLTTRLDKNCDDFLVLVRDDPRFPTSEILKKKAMRKAIFTSEGHRFAREKGLCAVQINGKMLATAFANAHKDCGASALPRTVAVKGAKNGDIAGRGFKSAVEYFTALFGLGERGGDTWYVRAKDVLGKDSVVNNAIVADKLDWCIAANVADGTPANVPVLVTANFNPALLLRKWDGKTDADTILPIGPASGAAKSMFDDVAVVVVYKDYSVKRINAKELTYAAIYGKPFDATKGNPPLAYLTPTRVAEPTGGK